MGWILSMIREVKSMACEYCRMIPHHPRCPEASELKIVYYCSECKEPIYEGQMFYHVGKQKYCYDCMDEQKEFAEVEDWNDDEDD